MKPEELKPCPFCGGKVTLVTHLLYTKNDEFKFNEYYVECKKCLLKTNPFYVEEELTEYWNTRHQPEPRREDVVSPLLCMHANEVPSICPCDDNCYCKNNTCEENGNDN